MYEAYWQLKRKPFECGADPSLYYPGEAHQGALLKLRYAIESGAGAALLAGASGSGKTLLVKMLAARLGESFAPFVHVVFPQMPPADLLAYLSADLAGLGDVPSSRSLDESVRRIERLVSENAGRGRHAVLAIDEAHLLEGGRTFEALRLLLNFEVEARPGLTLLLVGQPALLPILERLPHFDERLAVKCLLRPFTVEETMSYVEHRLAVAGSTRSIFAQAALEAIHRLTQGLPRRINRLCDLALLIGFAEELKTLGAAHIEAVAGELVAVAPE